MKLLLLIPTITLISYLIYIWRTFGILPSISDSYRYVKQKWLFTLVLWAVALPIIVVGANPLLFFAGAGICFVGAAPKFWESLEGTVHVAGAVGGIALGTLWVILAGLWWLALPFVILAALIQLKIKNRRILEVKNHTWWTEVAAFVMILVALLIH